MASLLTSLLPSLLKLGGGAALAGGAGLLGGKKALTGTPGELRQMPQYTQQQQNVLNRLLGQGDEQLMGAFGYLGDILGQSPEAMQRFQAPAMRQFREEIIPDIAQRFGEQGALSSSGFQQTLGQAGERLGEQLAAQRSQLGMQGLGQLQSLLGMGLSPQFSYQQIPGAPGMLQMLMGGR